MKYLLTLILLLTLGCERPTPIPFPPAPAPPLELLDLPKQAWAGQGLIAWELPAVPFDSNSSNMTTGERLGYFAYGAEVIVEKYVWSVLDQNFWIYLRQNDLAGWVPFSNSLYYDRPPQAEVTFQTLYDSLPTPGESIALSTRELDGRLMHDLRFACVQVTVYGTDQPIVEVIQTFHDQSIAAGWDFADRFNIRSAHYITLTKPGIGWVLLYSLNGAPSAGYSHYAEKPLDTADYSTIYAIEVSYYGPVSGCGWTD